MINPFWLRFIRHIAVCITVAVLAGCHPTKRLEKNQYLIDQNKVIVKGGHISGAELTPVTRTQPNRTILGARFHLWLYNLADPERAERRQKIIDNRPYKIRRDARRERKGKSPKPRRKSIGNWLRQSAGEAPVILDSTKVYTSKKNLNLYMIKMGYFDNTVRDSMVMDTAGKRVRIFYIVDAKEPYYIDTIIYEYKDKKLFKQIEPGLPDSKIKAGQIVNINDMDAERLRITTILRDKGYYSFTKDYIKFKIDSSKVVNMSYPEDTSDVSHKVRVKVILKQAMVKTSDSTVVEDNHKRFTINRIFVTLNPADFLTRNDIHYDTLKYTDKAGDIYYFLYSGGRLMYKPSALLSHVYVKPGLYYRSKEVESTYKKLSGLNTFRVVNINLYEDHADPLRPGLDTKIYLSPLKRHIFLSEATGTNRGGNLGASVNLTYKNRNIFRGAEQLSLIMHGGIEAQQLLTNQDEQIVSGVVSEILPNTFNTLEFGPEISLSFPKFLVPFNVIKISKNSSPKTVFNAKFNYQRRPDFSRAIQEASLSYDWSKTNELSREEYQFHFSPLKLSAVKLPKLSDQFRAHLNSLRDPLLKYSYTDHLVLGLQGGVTYTVQKNNRTRDMLYIKGNFEQSGLTLYNLFKWANAPKDSIGSYEILGIRFAHFIKTDVDFRYFININKSGRMAYRTMVGIGVPLANLNEALPFEKAFYAGGANGLRGWRSRTLGPGSYYDTVATFDKIGEFQLEGNLEYRFELIKIIEAAFFVDAGNIWLLKKNEGRPQGHLTPQFYEQIAMDAGVGVRLDFDFFIFRFDFAVPLRDPGFPEGEKWIFQPKTVLNSWRQGYSIRNPDYVYKPYRFPVTLNFAIGYPF